MKYVLSHQAFTFDLHSCLSYPSFKDSHSSTQYWVQVKNPVLCFSSWNTNWIAMAQSKKRLPTSPPSLKILVVANLQNMDFCAFSMGMEYFLLWSVYLAFWSGCLVFGNIYMEIGSKYLVFGTVGIQKYVFGFWEYVFVFANVYLIFASVILLWCRLRRCRNMSLPNTHFESVQMVLKDLKWIYCDAYLWQTMRNHAKKSMEGPKQPTSVLLQGDFSDFRSSLLKTNVY